MYNDFAITKVGVDESQTVIHVDNQGAIGLAKNPVAHNKSKHIDIKFHFLRDVVMKKKITLKYVRSQDNVADVFTKVATKIKLNNFKDAMFSWIFHLCQLQFFEDNSNNLLTEAEGNLTLPCNWAQPNMYFPY